MGRSGKAVLRWPVAAGIGYLCGTVPSADVVARIAGSSVDLRNTGTGNPGAANAAMVLGARFGLMVMGADIVKGVVAGRVGGAIAGPDGVHVAATAAVVGHCLPVWNGFRGGKGVATSVGQVLVAFPAYFPIDAAVAVATAAVPWWNERAFVATATAASAWVVASTVWWRRGLPNLWGPRPSAALPISAVVSSSVVVWRFVTADPAPGDFPEQPPEHDTPGAG
jgi:glycerol-3-phosphate acyltransferase PlsY